MMPSLTQIADQIRPAVEGYTLPFPAILEIPSKEHAFGKRSQRFSPSCYLIYLFQILRRTRS
jgi:hypothetical protein